MTPRTVEVKSKNEEGISEVKFSYTFEEPDTLQEAVDKFGQKECLEWLNAGRKAEINAQKWAEHKGTSTEKMEVNGKTFRVPKELAAILRQAQSEKAGATAA